MAPSTPSVIGTLERARNATPDGWHEIDFSRKHGAAKPKEPRPAPVVAKKAVPEANPDAKRMLAYPE